MKISKTSFINYLRCDRYVALEELYKEKQDAIVSFSEDLSLEDLIGEENKAKKSTLISEMYNENNDEDLIDKIDEQLEMLLPYYDKLEIISGNAITKLFSGEIIYDLDTKNQKHFSYNKDGFDFHCFLDGYQEDDKTVRIFETKATTSNKFSKEKYFYRKKGSKDKYPMFIKDNNGMYVPAEEKVENISDSYYSREKKLLDRNDDLGRYVYDLAYQRYVYERAINSRKDAEYYLVVLNHDYIHDESLSKDGEQIYSDDLVRFYNLTSITKKIIPTIEKDANLVIKRLNRMDARSVCLGKHCNRGKTYECIFYDICHSHIPKENNMFTYTYNHHGFKDTTGNKYEIYDLINNGTVDALDIPKEWLNRKNNIIQREVIESGVTYYNKEKIRDGISQLKYPIYHLDFESFNCPLPRFKGEKAYTQSLFQFSIHIERKPGECDFDNDHHHFLAKDNGDVRRELTKKLLSVIKDDGGSVLTYNASFEKGRIKDLQTYFPEYKNKLQDINSRVFDLMNIVKTNTKMYESLGYSNDEAKSYNFYHKNLNGSYSLKKVLPIFSDLTYEGMAVANGNEAMVAYSKLDSLKGKEYEQTYVDLVNYCKQDTWAMYEILDQLRKI